ncbi:MAG: NAD-dependent epimerase/dehydratase family protein [Candidatus Sericytochromatia bacterium]
MKQGQTSRYLITGATGFLGRHVIEQLAASEAGFIPLVRDPLSWEQREWGKDLQAEEVVCGGLDDLERWQDSLPSLAGIFHLAALVRHSRSDSEVLYAANVQGTLNMVKLAARKKCRLVFVSTSGTVGVFNSKQEWADEHSPYCEPMISDWPYYDSKLQAEREARKLAQELGVELVIIRPPVLLGPGDHRFRSTGHIIRYMRKRLPFLIRGGMHFIDIRDAAAALIRAMIHESPQPVYHLSGVACSIDSFFRMVEKASGIGPVPPQLPHPLALTIARTASGLSKILPGNHESPLPDPVVVEMAGKYWDVRSRYAAKDLGFQNRHGQDTIDDTVKWLKNHHPQLR